MNDQVISFERVTKRFSGKTAVDALDLVVRPGCVLGLVGRNGAGKTTSLRLALGTLYADQGTIRVLGLDPIRDAMEVRTRLSLLSEESHLYPWMTVGEMLDFGAALHPRWNPEKRRRFVESLELVESEKIESLSRGTKAKIALVLGVACQPDLLLLDDPTAGLDPLVRREVLQGVLESVTENGGAVIYASHLIHDVERVADRVAFLDAGRLQLEDSLESLKQQVQRVRIVFDESVPAAPEPFPDQLDAQQEGRLLTVVARGQRAALESHARTMGAINVEVESLSLEEILVASLRGKTLENAHV